MNEVETLKEALVQLTLQLYRERGERHGVVRGPVVVDPACAGSGAAVTGGGSSPEDVREKAEGVLKSFAGSQEAILPYITQARVEGESRGYRAGLERAAALMDKFYPNSQFDGWRSTGEYHKPPTFGAAIRALGSPDLTGEGE